MSTITGTTTVLGRQSHAGHVHRINVGATEYSAAYLASTAAPAELYEAATTPVLACLECGGGPFSAVDLYRDSAIPGECASCASAYISTASAPDSALLRKQA